MDGATTSTLLPALLTVAAFASGVVVGWMWWGRRFFSARLTRSEALSIVHGRLEADLLAKDREIERLRARLGDGGG